MGAAARWHCRKTTPCGATPSRSGNRRSEAEMTFAPVHHILPLATIIRERLLPIKGTVLARVGQKVNPADIVAEAVWAREHFFLDISRSLNVPPDEADR